MSKGGIFVLDRPMLKSQARDLMRVAQPRPLTAGIIYALLGAVVSYLSTRLTGVSYQTLERTLNFIAREEYDRALAVWTAAQPGVPSRLIDLALRIAMTIVGVGFTIFMLRTVRGSGGNSATCWTASPSLFASSCCILRSACWCSSGPFC